MSVISFGFLNAFTDEVPPFALVDDRVVEVRGDRGGVHQSVELISEHLRKYLVDHSVIPLFEIQVSLILNFIECYLK